MNHLQPGTRISPVALILLSTLLTAACQNIQFPDFANVEPARRLVVNQAIPPLRLVNNGGRGIESCTARPALPDGLVVQVTGDKHSCELLGAPTASANEATYTITGNNRRGPDTATITLTVFATFIRPSLSNVSSAQSYSTGGAITPFVFTNNGGQNITECKVKGDSNNANNAELPAGLRLAPDAAGLSCEISGTPSRATPRQTYTIAATNGAGESNATITITVNTGSTTVSGAPALVAPTIPPFTATTMITPVVFTNNGGAPQASDGCLSVPALPNGLSISRTSDGRSCQITGTPTAMTPTRTYSITAVNGDGSSSVTVSVTVN